MRTTLPAAAVLLLVAGCCRSACRPCAPCVPVATLAPGPTTRAPAAAGTPSPRVPAVAVSKDPAPGSIVEGGTGRRLAFDRLIDELAKASVVYVGERHDQAAHHEFQARVLEALRQRWKADLVGVGMEMFQTPAQGALDDYVEKRIDEATLLEKTEWKTRWGFGWEMYAPMVRSARAHGRMEVVALNAPKEVTHEVAKGGLEALTPEQRASLPPLDLSDGAHRAFVLKAFGAHGAAMPKDKFERFYTAQVIWEEVMSSSIARWLDSKGKGDPHMLVVIGAGHVADRFGVPARAEKKSHRPYATVVCEVTDPAAAPSTDDEPPRLDKAYADYTAWFAPSSSPQPAGKSPAKP